MLLFFLAGVKKPEQSHIYGKEGMVIVALAWILWSLFGAMPFTISGFIPNYMDAFFETVSGFTTTGSSILRDVEALPQCLLFWRSLTHWIGGMGVLVFVLVLTSLDKKNSMYLMRAEVPGAGEGQTRSESNVYSAYLIWYVSDHDGCRDHFSDAGWSESV